MATLAQVRAGLITRLETITGVRGYSEYPDMVTGSAAAAVVQYQSTDYDSAMNEGDVVNFTATLLVPKTSDRVAKDRLDEFLDPGRTSTTGVRAAVNGTLGGAAAFATVTGAGSYGSYQLDGGEVLGVEFQIQVTVT
jgi:hypothetical protein